MMLVVRHFIFGFICTVGFSLTFNAPKASLMKSGLAGGIGWSLYIVTYELTQSAVFSTFLASLCIGVIGEQMAIYYRNPITVYIIPSIVPLVPGYKLYYTMLNLIEKDFDGATLHGSEAFMIAVAIAGALTIVLSVNSFRKRVLQKRMNPNRFYKR